MITGDYDDSLYYTDNQYDGHNDNIVWISDNK